MISDPTANWTDYVHKTSGTSVLDQDREHNHVNEIDSDDVHGDTDNPISQITGTTWADPVHDAAGNMTTVPKPSKLDDGLTLKYDAWNRLVEVEDDEAEVTVAKYEYNGRGWRIVKQTAYSGGSPQDTYDYYHNANWQVVEEHLDGDATYPVAQYVWHPYYIDAPAVQYYDADTDGVLNEDNDGDHYYTHDANFNVTALLENDGDALERYHYTPYGDVTIYTGDWSSTRSSSLYSNPYLYTGREYDAETGLYHYRNRHYHAELGRFISRDPVTYAAGDVNLYRYVKNAPPAARDPFGLKLNWREKLWCLDNRVCCCFARNSPATVDAEMKRRYGISVVPDDSVLNAVYHCTLTVSVSRTL